MLLTRRKNLSASIQIKVQVLIVASGCLLHSSFARATACDHLTALTIPYTEVSSATAVSAATFSPPAANNQGGPASFTLPAFCRVLAVARPTVDSEIHFEIWLPAAEAWSGRFLGTGNGGYSSALTYRQMADALEKGYATAGSDTGHSGGDLKFGVGHPEKINDWVYRSVHVMTETAHLVMRSYYGKLAEHSYFWGCSTGGHQALTEAQRYPDDYDGIIAGAAANNRIRQVTAFLWNWRVLHEREGETLPSSKLPLLHNAVMAACDALDGVKDGIITDPRRCKFDPASLACKGADAADCLTESQVAQVRKIYDGARNPRTGEQIYSGWERGSEFLDGSTIGSWAGYFVGKDEPARLEFWRSWVFHDPSWDPRSFDFNQDVKFADQALPQIDSMDANLTPFNQRHGRLLMYYGWADPVVPPEEGIRYYESVERTTPGARDFARLFMVPGMGHCGGGPGPDAFDALGTLDHWVSEGEAPDKIVASHSSDGKIDRTRLLCPWPQAAKWKGSGSTDDAASFVCRAE
ncbi:MAG TPA: tannase/feruloyl esterase family alpha/beta hydrolase [Candidatus Sulfotelmatobacter sp.]|nr:tannase/feruloyl esterase family alpha/beta hydrolase [Candidatus Sulfotelmatobacter sp.]